MRWAALDERTRTNLASAALVALALLAYAPVVGCGWVWDDDKYVTENEALVAPGGLVRIWTEPRATPQYYPLVHTTFWVERGLWGLDPAGFHVVNVVLHGLSALILWRLLRRLRLPGAWAAAAVFAVHPVGVETVAWVTERKNTLSLLMALLSALCLLPLATGDENEEPRWNGRAWLGGAALLGLGLLSKTVVCTLPAVLLVLTWWRRGRIERWQLAALLPLLVAGGLAGLATAHLERVHVGASSEAFDLSLSERALIAGRATWFYLGKLVWPHPLVFSYERWSLEPWRLAPWLWPSAAVLLVCGLWLFRDRLGRGPLAATLIYGGVLLPALGIVDVYPFKYSYVADHFQYHAMPAALALLVSGCAIALQRSGERAPREGILAATLIVLGALTVRQLGAWKDEEALWRDTIEKNPRSLLAAGNLGARLGVRGQRLLADDATREQGRALLLEARRLLRVALPHAADRHDLLIGVVNLGRTERDLGDHRAAADFARWAAELAPGSPDPLAEAGQEAAMAGDEAAAKQDFEAALALAPTHRAARLGLALLLVEAKDPALRDPTAGQVLAEQLVLESRHQSLEALAVLASARFARGDKPGAIDAAQEALRLARQAGRTDVTAELEADLARYRGS